MMEKAVSPHTFVLALSYSEETEHSRRSARMFDYQDVSDFIKRVRRQMEYHLGHKGALSFIACGEQGDRFKRCHWHLVLFGQVDFLTLGEWKAPWGVVTDRKDIISPKPVGTNPTTIWRRQWSLWRHGFVTVQEPDYGGMRYAMAYALKDQFNMRNAAGTMREMKSEIFGTGYLAMSKKPPIGARFVDAYIAQCDAGGYVPPSRKLTIPEVNYPWWPTGSMADRLLDGLAEVNRRIKDRTGRNASGWSSLVYEARESADDLERLGENEQEEGQEKTADDLAADIAASHADDAGQCRIAAQRRRCGSTEACNLCLRGATGLVELGIFETGGRFYRQQDENYINKNGHRDPVAGFAARQFDGKAKGPNPLCALYADPAIRARDYARVFPQSAG